MPIETRTKLNMHENKGSILGTIVTGGFAILSKAAENFEAHASSYAALGAIIAAGFTVANIIRGWIKKPKD